MKKLIRTLSYGICILLACVLCVGCSKKKQPKTHYETVKCKIDSINTAGFNEGDMLIINENGELEKYVLWGEPIGQILDSNRIELYPWCNLDKIGVANAR